MTRLDKTRKVLNYLSDGRDGARYNSEDTFTEVILTTMDYEDLGRPLQITVTIEPGDLLN